MKQNGKRSRNLDMDEGPQQRKRGRIDVSDLLLCDSAYLSSTLHAITDSCSYCI